MHTPSRDQRHMRLTAGSPAVHALMSHRPMLWKALHRPEFPSTCIPGCGFTTTLRLAPSWRMDLCLHVAVAALVRGLNSVSSWTRLRLPLARAGLVHAPGPRASQVWSDCVPCAEIGCAPVPATPSPLFGEKSPNFNILFRRN